MEIFYYILSTVIVIVLVYAYFRELIEVVHESIAEDCEEPANYDYYEDYKDSTNE